MDLKNLKQFDIYEVMKIPVNHQVVSSRFVLTNTYSHKTKCKQYKARLVVRGYKFKTEVGKTLAPTPHLDNFRLVVAYCASIALTGLSLHCIDFVSAFLNAVSGYLCLPRWTV